MTERDLMRRRYGEKEIGLILKRASELQHKQPEGTTEGAGLTLADLEEIAAEAGIDRQHLRQAAAELESGLVDERSGVVARLLGGPLSIELERSLPGELAERDFERLVSEIQRTAEGHGQASKLGRTLTWQSRTPNTERSLQVTVSSRDGRTLIRIEEQYNQLAGALFGGMLGGGGGGVGLGVGLGVGIGALGSAAFAILFPATVISGAYLLARTIFGSTVRRRRRILRELLDRLTELVEASGQSQLQTERSSRQLRGN